LGVGRNTCMGGPGGGGGVAVGGGAKKKGKAAGKEAKTQGDDELKGLVARLKKGKGKSR